MPAPARASRQGSPRGGWQGAGSTPDTGTGPASLEGALSPSPKRLLAPAGGKEARSPFTGCSLSPWPALPPEPPDFRALASWTLSTRAWRAPPAVRPSLGGQLPGATRSAGLAFGAAACWPRPARAGPAGWQPPAGGPGRAGGGSAEPQHSAGAPPARPARGPASPLRPPARAPARCAGHPAGAAACSPAPGRAWARPCRRPTASPCEPGSSRQCVGRLGTRSSGSRRSTALSDWPSHRGPLVSQRALGRSSVPAETPKSASDLTGPRPALGGRLGWPKPRRPGPRADPPPSCSPPRCRAGLGAVPPAVPGRRPGAAQGRLFAAHVAILVSAAVWLQPLNRAWSARAWTVLMQLCAVSSAYKVRPLFRSRPVLRPGLWRAAACACGAHAQPQPQRTARRSTSSTACPSCGPSLGRCPGSRRGCSQPARPLTSSTRCSPRFSRAPPGRQRWRAPLRPRACTASMDAPRSPAARVCGGRAAASALDRPWLRLSLAHAGSTAVPGPGGIPCVCLCRAAPGAPGPLAALRAPGAPVPGKQPGAHRPLPARAADEVPRLCTSASVSNTCCSGFSAALAGRDPPAPLLSGA